VTILRPQAFDVWDSRTTVVVSEQFGPTLQGEGPFAGRAVQFLRLMGCNLSCTWCDTPYTWDGSRYDLRAEGMAKTGHDIVAELIPNIPLVVSGGEPLLHQDNKGLMYVLRCAPQLGIQVHVETNGTIAPNPLFDRFVFAYSVSPKLDHAGPHRGNQNPALDPQWPDLAKRNPLCALKAVVRDDIDVARVVVWADQLGWPRAQVWVMPLGVETSALLENWSAIAAAAAGAKINATQRLHILAWGDKKGT
jgi:7-carboxy-7-deazaguanine synthase